MADLNLNLRLTGESSGLINASTSAAAGLDQVADSASHAADQVSAFQRQQAAFAREGVRLANSLVTPSQQYDRTIQQLTQHLSAQNISQEQFNLGQRRAEQQLQRTQQAVNGQTSAVNSLGQMLRNAAPYVAGFFAVEKIVEFGKRVFDVNANFQSLRTSLITVTGSANGAESAFQGIQEFANKTPYTVDQITESFIKLKALGLAPTEAALTSYGNTASAMNKPLMQMIEAVADAASSNFERLEDFGIKASKQGEDVEFTFQGVTTTVKNSADEITDYLQKIGNVNFAGGMDRQAQTIKGSLSTMGDAWDSFLDHIISSNGENAIAQWVQTAATALNKLDNWLNGPSTIKGKIAELDSQIAAKIDQVQAHKSNGMIGGLVDDLLGFDANKTLNQVDALQKKRAEMVAESVQSQKQLSEITQGRIAAQSAENKALGEKFDLETRLKNLLDGQYKQQLIAESKRQGLDPRIALTIASLETNSGSMPKNRDNNWVSPADARGLMQITKGTASDLSASVGLSPDVIRNTVEGSIKAGVAYLKQISAKHHDDVKAVFASYNAGPNRKQSFYDMGYKQIAETRDYVKHGQQIYDALSEAAGGVEKFTKSQAKGREETFRSVTGQEKLLAATMEAEDLRNKGLISQAGYNQMLLDAQGAYDKLSEKTFNAITPGEQLNETLNKLHAQLGAGQISQAGFTLEQQRAIKSYQDATGITESYTLAKAAEEKQQKAVNDALKQYTDLQAISTNIQDQAQFADQLADVGFTTDQIRQQLDIYKQINEAVKQNPLLDPGQVQEMTFTRIQGEIKIQESTRTEGQKSIDIVSQAWEQSVKNMQTSLSNGIKGVLTGDALNSFKAFADNLKNTLYDAVSNALSAGLIDGFKNNDWLSVGKSALMIGLSSLGGLLSKSSPTASTPSKALSAAAGTGAMSIADIQSRGAGYEFASASVKQYNQDIKNITNAGLSITNQIMGDFGAKLVESIASKAGSWASSFAGAAKSLSTTAGNAIAGIGSIYTLFDYFSNLGKLLDSGNIVRIAGQTMVAAGAAVTGVMSAAAIAGSSMNPVGWVIGAVLAAVGGLMSLFSKDRIPNNWQNTFNPLQSQENPNRSNAAFDRNAIKNVYIDGKAVPVGADGTYYSTGNKSATAGVVTEFGATQFSSHEMNQSMDSIKNQFGGLLGIIREFDGSLSKAVGSGAMAFYSKWLGDAADNTIKFKQNAQDLDTGAMLFDRYDRIINKLAESGDAKAQTVNVWFDALMSKFSKTDANFEQLVLSVVGGISNNVEQFAQMPASLAKLVVDSVKGTSAGASVKDVLGEASKVIGVYQAVNAGLSAMGASANQDAVVGFLASMNKISYSVQDAGSNLLAYADVLRIMGQNVDVAAAAQAKLNALQQSGASNDLITAYFSSAGVIAQKLQTMGASFTDANLDATALHISNLAKASQEAARNVVDHAIASENLGDKSRESAIAILLSSKKLDEQTVKISEYSGAVAEFTKQQIEGLDYIQWFMDATSTKFSDLGIETKSLVTVTDTLIKRYGSINEAMNEHVRLLRIAFGAEYVDKLNRAAATEGQQRILDRNPDFKAAGLYAGMNEENFQAAVKYALGVTGISEDQAPSKIITFADMNSDFRSFMNFAEINSGKEKATPASSGATGGSTGDGPGDIKDFTVQLSDFMQPFRDSAATRGMTDYQKELYNLQSVYESNLVEARKLGAGYDDLALITADYSAKVADAAKAQAKAINDIISSVNKDFSRLNSTDFENSLWSIRDSFINTIQSAALAGATYGQLLTIAAAGARTGANALQKAKDEISKGFEAIYQTISDKRTDLGDKISVLQGANADDLTKARALADLKSTDYNKQLSAIDTLMGLSDQKYQKELTNAKSINDYLNSLVLNDSLSPLSPLQQRDEALKQALENLDGAKKGDQNAFDKLTGSFDTLLTKQKAISATSQDYERVFRKGQFELQALAGTQTTKEQAEQATIQQVKELQGLQKQLDVIEAGRRKAQQDETAKLVAAYQKVGDDFTAALQKMADAAGLNKDVKFDLSALIVTDAAKAEMERFKNSIFSALTSAALSPADVEIISSSSKTFIEQMAGLITTAKLEPSDTAILLDSQTGLVDNLGRLVTAQHITGSDAAVLYKASVNLFGDLAGAVNRQLISNTEMRVIYSAQTELVNTLSSGILAAMITPVDAGNIVSSSTAVLNSLLTALNAGTISKPDAQAIYFSSKDLVGSLVASIASGYLTGADVGRITGAVSGFINNIASTVSVIDLAPADRTLYSNALSVMSSTISGALASRNFTADQLGVLISGLGAYAANPAKTLSALNFSQDNLTTLQGALTAAAGNPAEVLRLLGFSAGDQDYLKTGVNTLAQNMQTGLSSVEWLREPGATVEAGINALAGNINSGLTGLVIDPSPVGAAIAGVMSSVAAAIANAQSQAAIMAANAEAQAASIIAAAQQQALLQQQTLNNAQPIIDPAIVATGKTININGIKIPAFADGGITNGLSFAGEAGREAVVPLPDGRTIPVTLRGSSETDKKLDAVVKELESLKKEQAKTNEENKKLQIQMTLYLKKIADLQEKADVIGPAPARAEA